MAAPTVATEDTRRPDSLFGVLFVMLGLMLVVGLGVAVLGLRVQGADSRELYDDLFEPGVELPYSLHFAGGTAVASKQRWVRLERTVEPAEPRGDVGGEGDASTASAADGAAESSGGVPGAPTGDLRTKLPEVVLIGRYAGPVPVARQFETGNLPSGQMLSERRKRWLEKPDQRSSWQGLVDRGVVGFGPWEADYVHLRQFLDDGSFYDLIRVNLSSADTGQILVAHWPLGNEHASVEPLKAVLDVLRLSDGQDSGDTAGV
ncbi:hypothetical protein [Engelhardtia mirabilis]|uniref:Uncharacterized protein n=1 Tax=Engelhardtia mirabilis TaxID=2528011 RepID=A0A518BQP1_9BACT|nr:hypothetical protein Pla133_44130 [Planctomycetes bacterium Pla133]QDV03620.1 hypothetical protein Pla86_44110 [Planctomycetes bacterium Pla86]